MSKQRKGQSSSGRTFKFIHQSFNISDVNFRKQTIIVSGVHVCQTGTFQKPFSTNFCHVTKPKLVETVLLFCRVTDVSFLKKKMEP